MTSFAGGGSMTRGRWLLGIAFLLVTMAGNAEAQFNGDNLDGKNRERTRFLNETLRETNTMMDAWRRALQQDQLKDAVDFFESDALYAPLWGEQVQGRDRIQELLGEHLASIQSFQTSAVDFTASGILAYQFGRVYYLRAVGAAQQPLHGTYVAVFVRNGRDWKLRSYVERSDAPQEPTDR